MYFSQPVYYAPLGLEYLSLSFTQGGALGFIKTPLQGCSLTLTLQTIKPVCPAKNVGHVKLSRGEISECKPLSSHFAPKTEVLPFSQIYLVLYNNYCYI